MAPSVGPEAPTAVVSFPTDPGAPITVDFISASLQVIIVEKDSVPKDAAKIPAEEWAVAGVYVLLGAPTKEGLTVRARPGYGADVLKRLRDHPTENPWFVRAIVARDKEGWNSAQAGYLEGRLHDLCRESPEIDHDFRRDGDDTLQLHEEGLLERRALAGIIGTLRITGVGLQPIW
jgi:hypothetical protein